MDRWQVLLVALGAAIVIRILSHFVDRARIRDEIQSKGGRVISIRWKPFGRGWFFEKNERHYSIVYLDRSGATVSTDCKTSLFTGVYWADGPNLQEQRPRLMARHRCFKCGYAINAEWRACPNCGVKMTLGSGVELRDGDG
jgi:hypothetical protein